jgi:hypothetical protein
VPVAGGIWEMEYSSMNRRSNSRLNMGLRVLEFSQANPIDSAGFVTTRKQLQEQVALARQLVEEQQRGITEVRGATGTKERLKRAIRRNHLIHFEGVAIRAASEVPEVVKQFDLPRLPIRGLDFRAAARTMVEAAEQQKELLAKHGLMDEIVTRTRALLDEYDGAVERGAEGRRIHIGASAKLETATTGIVQLVNVLDGMYRFAFADDSSQLASWVAASNIIGPPRAGGQSSSPQTPATGAPPSSGSINPAA